MLEEWRDIKEYEGRYQISNLGRVKSLARVVATSGNSNHSSFYKKERVLKLGTYDRYVSVVLCKDGQTKRYGVHRLVAQAFLPNPNNYPCVNHKDENRHNNVVTNLEWCTYKYNNEYNNRVAKCKKKISATLRAKQYHHKMTLEQIEHIRQGAIKGWRTRRRNQHTTEQEEV